LSNAFNEIAIERGSKERRVVADQVLMNQELWKAWAHDGGRGDLRLDSAPIIVILVFEEKGSLGFVLSGQFRCWSNVDCDKGLGKTVHCVVRILHSRTIRSAYQRLGAGLFALALGEEVEDMMSRYFLRLKCY